MDETDNESMDMSYLCRLVANRSDQLLRLEQLKAPSGIMATQERLLDEAVSRLHIVTWLYLAKKKAQPL